MNLQRTTTRNQRSTISKELYQESYSSRIRKFYTKQCLLDHGFVRVVDYMGDDTSIVQAARVSYGKELNKFQLTLD